MTQKTSDIADSGGLTPLFAPTPGAPARAAIFLSGSGSNAEHVLELWQSAGRDIVDIVALVTDRPTTSRASEIARAVGLPVIALDIREFYSARGCRRISIATSEGRQIREAWTGELLELLKPHAIDIGVFAGFVPLTNMTAHIPCLNVHPGDLTWLKDGRRHLVGLHTIPVERAILERLDALRSSVILAEPYTGRGDDMDSGPLLGISKKVPIDLMGASVEELQAAAAARPETRPKGGFKDRLEQVAEHNQDRLKKHGDWVVLPRVVLEFAAGNYAVDAQGSLFFRDSGWNPAVSVIFGEDSKRIIAPQ